VLQFDEHAVQIIGFVDIFVALAALVLETYPALQVLHPPLAPQVAHPVAQASHVLEEFNTNPVKQEPELH